MSIEDPAEVWETAKDLELFHMDRELAIFTVLCRELMSRGKVRPYKAAQIAEAVEQAICAWEKWQKR